MGAVFHDGFEEDGDVDEGEVEIVSAAARPLTVAPRHDAMSAGGQDKMMKRGKGDEKLYSYRRLFGGAGEDPKICFDVPPSTVRNG